MRLRTTALCVALAFASSLTSAPTVAAPLDLQLGLQSFRIEAPPGYARVKLILVSPSGDVYERHYLGSGAQRFDLAIPMAAPGAWHYSLVFQGAADTPRAATGSDDSDGRRQGPGQAWPVLQGALRVGGSDAAEPSARGGGKSAAAGNAGAAPKDQVINDDLIVTGGICAGLDCINGEPFEFVTLKLKENNTRLHFEDTSSGTGFAGDDWTLEANDNASGGANRFSIVNRTQAKTPFTVLGGAPDHALFVDATGRMGVRNPTPVLDLHPVNGNTPGLRLDQSGAGGFTPQVWDVAGNESNFFVRDVTNGSRLPLRIRPGAPTSAIDIAASGNVGMGTGSPGAKLDIAGSHASETPVPMLRVTNSALGAGLQDRFAVDSNGNVTARGTISQLSSRATKEEFEALPGPLLLAKLETLPVPAWRYRDAEAGERHIGPMAEDFHATFGVGADPRFLSPGDVAGVALASVKALQDEVKQRDQRIAELEARLQRLEALLVEPR